MLIKGAPAVFTYHVTGLCEIVLYNKHWVYIVDADGLLL